MSIGEVGDGEASFVYTRHDTSRGTVWIRGKGTTKKVPRSEIKCGIIMFNHINHTYTTKAKAKAKAGLLK